MRAVAHVGRCTKRWSTVALYAAIVGAVVGRMGIAYEVSVGRAVCRWSEEVGHDGVVARTTLHSTTWSMEMYRKKHKYSMSQGKVNVYMERTQNGKRSEDIACTRATPPHYSTSV